MPIINGYATLDDLKARLNITDNAEDAMLEAVITAASRSIDNETGRVFYSSQGTKVFSAEFSDLLFVDDVFEVTSLKTDADGDRVYEQVWCEADYDLEPINERPYTKIRTVGGRSKSFPIGRRSVEITGMWGYPSVPPTINEACLLYAARLYKRKDAPFGVLGTPDIGVARIPRSDVDVQTLLWPYKRVEILA